MTICRDAMPRETTVGSAATGLKGTGEGLEEEESNEPWDDWMPEEQTAMDIILKADAAKTAVVATSAHGEEDDDDEWNPTQQCAAETSPDSTNVGNGCADSAAVGNAGDAGACTDSDDDWAPQVQGAASSNAECEKEALERLLRPTHLVEAEKQQRPYETKREADAAGRLLQELKRPPTVKEAKEDIPRGPDVDVDTLPAPAYRTMTEEEAIAMVNRGASVNLNGQHGRAPLHKAVELAYPMLCKAISDAGGDVDIRDNFGETPLLLLAQAHLYEEGILEERRIETMQKMLSLGADVHAVNPRGRGVLHLACADNDHKAIQTFIEGMANVNAQDLAGFTPLMWAAGRNGIETVRILLDARADVDIKAIRGQTALTFALTNGNDAVADSLERHKMLLDERAAEVRRGGGDDDSDGREASTISEGPKPRPDWACTKDPPKKLEPYEGRRVYKQAKPDRHSNVYA